MSSNGNPSSGTIGRDIDIGDISLHTLDSAPGMMDMDIDPEIDQSMNMNERNVVSGNEHQGSKTAKESFVQSTIQFKNADCGEDVVLENKYKETSNEYLKGIDDKLDLLMERMALYSK